jgi:hypothetical protein
MWRSARGQDVGKPRPAETVAALIARRAVGGQPDLPAGGHRGLLAGGHVLTLRDRLGRCHGPTKRHPPALRGRASDKVRSAFWDTSTAGYTRPDRSICTSRRVAGGRRGADLRLASASVTSGDMCGF